MIYNFIQYVKSGIAVTVSALFILMACISPAIAVPDVVECAIPLSGTVPSGQTYFVPLLVRELLINTQNSNCEWFIDLEDPETEEIQHIMVNDLDDSRTDIYINRLIDSANVHLDNVSCTEPLDFTFCGDEISEDE